jgi:hypothetical protein
MERPSAHRIVGPPRIRSAVRIKSGGRFVVWRSGQEQAAWAAGEVHGSLIGYAERLGFAGAGCPKTPTSLQ